MTDAPSSPSGSTLLPGQSVGSYELLELLSARRLATTFKARDRLLGRVVRLNHLHPTSGLDAATVRQGVERYTSLYKPVAADRPQLERFIEVLSDAGGVYTVTELLEGASVADQLTDLAQQGVGLDTQTTLGLLAAAATGLKALHDRQLVHGCVTPGHIVLPIGGGLKMTSAAVPALIDPQYALHLDAVPYTAPEVLQGEAPSPRSDLYALGMVAYQALAGRGGWEQAFKTVLRDQRSQAMRWMKWQSNLKVAAPPLTQLNPDVPEALSDLVARLIDKTPTSRIGSADALLDAIKRNFIDAPADGVAAEPTTFAPAGPRVIAAPDTAAIPRGGHSALWIGGSVALWIVLGSVVAGVLLKQRADDRRAVEATINQRISLVVKALNDGDAETALAEATQAEQAATEADADRLADTARAWQAFARAVDAETQNDFAAARAAYIDALDGDALQPQAWRVNAAQRLAEATTNAAFADGVQRIEATLAAQTFDDAQDLLDAWHPLTETEAEDQALARLQDRVDRAVGEGSVDAVLARVDELVTQDRLTDALVLLERSINRGNTDPRLVDRYRGLAGQMDFNELVADARDAVLQQRFTQAVTAFDRALQARPNDEGVRAERNAAFSRARLLEARAALDANDAARAVTLLRQALQADPTHTEAERLLAGLTADSDRLAVLQQAEAAMQRRDWTAANTLFDEARTLATDPSDVATINQRQAEARVNLHMDAADQALGAGDTAAAQDAFQRARQVNATHARVVAFDTQLQRQRDYDSNLATGREAFERGQYGQATRLLLRAQEVLATPEVADLIAESRFQQRLGQARSYMANNNFREAEATLRTLRDERPDSQDVQDLLNQIGSLPEDDEDPGVGQ